MFKHSPFPLGSEESYKVIHLKCEIQSAKMFSEPLFCLNVT